MLAGMLALGLVGALDAGGPPNLIDNGHFVADLTGWERVGSIMTSYWSDLDVDGSTGSGSVQLRASIEGRHVLRRQCLRVLDQSARYRYEVAIYRELGSAPGYPSVGFTLHDGPSCSSPLMQYGVVMFYGMPGTWRRNAGELEIPTGTPAVHSIQIELAMTRGPLGGVGDAIGNIDSIELYDDDRILVDGFDSVESRLTWPVSDR